MYLYITHIYNMYIIYIYIYEIYILIYIFIRYIPNNCSQVVGPKNISTYI